MDLCRKCSVVLIAGDNWFNGHAQHRNRICKICYYAGRRDFRRVNSRGDRRQERLRSKYGIGKPEVAAMFIEQAKSCAICLKEVSEDRQLCVDHCHVTSEVRGLLCTRCNNMIGYFETTSATTWQRAMDYLKR
jgi:hypothetical protein